MMITQTAGPGSSGYDTDAPNPRLSVGTRTGSHGDPATVARSTPFPELHRRLSFQCVRSAGHTAGIQPRRLPEVRAFSPLRATFPSANVAMGTQPVDTPRVPV